ncbi:MAG TPA: hypothetical protein VFK13_12075 [Gemmatimonadaceae bacterium]|nr:hypothetical protein [Gemmatimonadaceae bacterium]
MPESLTLQTVVTKLAAHHGTPEPPPTSDPFGLVLWENVAYLASPARRREAFAELARSVGTTPSAILEASRDTLERVTSRGILKGLFAAKLRECATIAIDELDGDLDAAVRAPLSQAKRALRKFPGIGEPGAEKILLFTGQHALLAPESNGVRVLVRLGLARDGGSYARTYAACRDVPVGTRTTPPFMQRAHLLLQEHGRTVCKRTAPRCSVCPLADDCAYARANPSARAAVPARRRAK